MKKKYPGKKQTLIPVKSAKKSGSDAYKYYPAEDDIYNNSELEADLQPFDPYNSKEINADPDAPNEKDFLDDISGGDLDVSGSELDDEMEDIGSEDEENNYYSIGGDRHDDLEEQKS